MATGFRDRHPAASILTILGLLLALGAGLGLWMTRREPESADPRAAASRRAEPAAPAEVSARPSPSARPAVATASGPRLDDRTRELMLHCTENVEALHGVHAPGDFDTLEDYIARAPDPEEAGFEESTELNLQNLHVRLPDGEVRRLQILPETGDAASDRRRVRYFGVDAQNLPVPMSPPDDWHGLDWQGIERKFRASGELLLDERTETLHWGEDVTARLRLRNGAVQEMQIFFRGHELACARPAKADPAGDKVDCRCL